MELAFIKKILLLISLGVASIPPAYATSDNIAPFAKASASSSREEFPPSGVNDGISRIDGKGEWISNAQQMFWGETDYPWVQLDWDQPVIINKVTLFDRAGSQAHAAGGELIFSDGTRMDIGELPENGAPKTISFSPITTNSLRVQITDGNESYIGLSEIEVFQAPSDSSDPVSLVDPYIETTRGRYFFFISGNQPYGMIGAAPLTRNKNQGGGGYNYNDRHILGFPQVHGWMLSGLDFMPAAEGVKPVAGEQRWKSAFSHDGEIVQPSYHRVYLEDYDVWVEQTATERSSMYRLTYTNDVQPNLLFNLGGYVGTSTMVNANVSAVSPTQLEGYFDTTGRLWGGPQNVRIYFVAQFNKPVQRFDVWDNGEYLEDCSTLSASSPSVARNEGLSYHDAPTSGINAVFSPSKADPILVKMAISYVSVDNAKMNLAAENPGWDFDTTRENSRKEWNEWLGTIRVKGGTDEQKVKFYTDMWHTLLGRHKINDINGEYPDRTQLLAKGNRGSGDDFILRKIRSDRNGKLVHNMYNSDALWLTQWNQNTLWGIAFPELLDDFSASMVEYGAIGGLIPRGPCAGGYSFIMSGCPATSLITSAYQRGLTHKWEPAKAYPIIKRNHETGGMLGYNSQSQFEFYKQNGYAPEKGGMTVQWTFEDWALSQMARKMGKKRDADYFAKRSDGWRKCIHPELHLLFPRNADGSWTHTDPMSGAGFEEANSWQTTFGISQDIPGLAEEMGGADTLCDLLNHAMAEGRKDNFIAKYGSGYVGYSNQPGLSTAHVFSHAGKPWLSQYWVREVKEHAYGSTSPYHGYGEHDEDQGQMSCVSALMAIGLFSLDGGSAINPSYDITSPVFDEITIRLDPEYYPGKEFRIITHNNSAKNCYIQKATLNDVEHESYRIPHDKLIAGGTLELWLGDTPNYSWGK